MSWLALIPGGVQVSVRVVPRASKTELAGVLGAALKIRLQAPPVDGKANLALREFLAERLGVRVRDVTLVTGLTGRDKRVEILGVTEAQARSFLLK